jgi:histidinol dehydrogenase
MRVKRFEWGGADDTAWALRDWTFGGRDHAAMVDAVVEIAGLVHGNGDVALLDLTERYDGVTLTKEQLRVDPGDAEVALRALEPAQRESLELAAANIRAVAEAQLPMQALRVELPQGQAVSMREVPVATVGIYAPGGRAIYPSTVLMCAIPAQVAGVERVVLVSPPGENGRPPDSILAAAALCGIDEIYAVGGAQAIFGLARGTETIPKVDMVVGPGNPWVQEAKRRVFGEVGIESFAGPSELMLVAGPGTDPEWAALDLCSQAEHGPESPLVAAATEERVLESIETATTKAAAGRVGVENAPLALVRVPDLCDAIDLANAYAPEHLQLMDEEAALLADMVTTAGCVFTSPFGATAFGDYVAGSNHVLPTRGTGRFAGPLSPSTFRRKISTVEVSAEAAAKLAPHVDRIARAEGFPVHGESAMIRVEKGT